jgi:hypothetical protein
MRAGGSPSTISPSLVRLEMLLAPTWCEIIVSGILPRGRDLYRVENGVAIQAPLLKLLNRKAGYINERLRYIASSLPRLTYTPHPRFVVDSVIQ